MAATMQQQRQTATETRTAVDEQMEAVLAQTEADLAAMRTRIGNAEPGLRKAAAMSAALQRARQLVTVDFIKRYIMPLMGSPLGFICDRPNKKDGPYSPEELVEPVTECLIRGFSVVGNEMNVISGRFYGAQAGYRRLVREIAGLTDLEEIPGEPVINFEAGKAIVRYIVRCKLNGRTWELKNENGEPGRKFTIRVNAGMGPDAVIGKAARKALKAAYEEMTGTPITETNDEEPEKTLPPEELPNGRSSARITTTEHSSNGSTNGNAPHADESPTSDQSNSPTTTTPQAEQKPQLSSGYDMPADELAQSFQQEIKSLRTKPDSDKLLGRLMKAKDYLGEKLYREVYADWKATAKNLK